MELVLGCERDVQRQIKRDPLAKSTQQGVFVPVAIQAELLTKIRSTETLEDRLGYLERKLHGHLISTTEIMLYATKCDTLETA